MRIALFHELPPGGAKNAVMQFGKYLTKLGISVDLHYVNDKREHHGNFTNEYYYKFTPKKWSGNNWKARLYKDTLELYSLKKLHKKIANEIDKKSYDFVFVHASKYTQSPFLLQILKTYSIYYCHDPHLRIAYEKILSIKKDLPLSRRIYEQINRYVRKRIDKKNMMNASLLVANSKFTKEGVKKAYGRSADVCYLGVDTSIFKPEEKKKEYDVLFAGSKEELDGYYDLEHALHYLEKVKVKILDFQTEWISGEKKMAEIYNSAQIVICLTHNEPLGLVPLEAMSCGLPVISVNEGGYKETVLHNKTGYLIKRDPKEIADKIAYLLKNKRIGEIMGKEGRKYIEKNWTWEESVERLLAIMREKK